MGPCAYIPEVDARFPYAQVAVQEHLVLRLLCNHEAKATLCIFHPCDEVVEGEHTIKKYLFLAVISELIALV